jgi:hypothetical protein
MNFQLISDITGRIIKTIENSAIAIVSSLRKHTFKIVVTNPVKKVDIKGTVIVGNQRKIEEKLKSLKSVLDKIEITNRGINRKKYDVEVLNPVTKLDVIGLDEVGGEIIKTNTSLDKLSKDVQSLHTPLGELKKVEISNQPIKELEKLEKELGKITKAIGKLKLEPNITVTPASLPKVIVPPATVTVEKQEIDYKKFGDSINIPEMDYNKLAKIIAKEIGGMVITGGGGGGTSYAFKDEQGNRGHALVDSYGHILISSQDITAKYQICDKDDDDENVINYFGFTDKNGAWYILRENLTNKTYRYIKGDNDYESNWTNRSSLTYDYYYNIF